MSCSVAVGIEATSWRMRSRQSGISFFSTSTTITGLQVAPTAPCSVAYASSCSEHESFQRQVDVLCVIWCRRLLYEAAVSVTVPPRRRRGV